jgi:hypothetical protein
MEGAMRVVDYASYQAELKRRREALGELLVEFDPSLLTHKPRDSFKRRWLAERGLLTTPREALGDWQPKVRKPGPQPVISETGRSVENAAERIETDRRRQRRLPRAD